MRQMTELLARAALEARQQAYCPYSHFAVGAALLAADGRVFTGCNVENATQGPGSCAERVALYQAVSEGARDFVAIAVAGGEENAPPTGFCPPCGVCRQALLEFCGQDFQVILVKEGGVEIHTLGELLPLGFQR